MPSFKTCLASIALFAFAFSPVAASVQQTRSLDIEANSLFARRESRMETAHRLRAARARKAKRESNGDELTKRATRKSKKTKKTKSKGKAFKDTSKYSAAFAAFTQTRCNRDDACIRAAREANLTTNGTLACFRRQCTVTCQQGYFLTDEGTCQQSAVDCGTPPPFGAFRTLTTGECKLVCFKSIGYTVSGNRCISLSSDNQNCGSNGRVCTASYNGIGSAVCSGGGCTLSCPPGRRSTLVQAPTGYACL